MNQDIKIDCCKKCDGWGDKLIAGTLPPCANVMDCECHYPDQKTEECKHGKEVGKTCVDCGGLCIALAQNPPTDFWKCSHGMIGTEGASCPKCREEETLNLLIEKLKELDAWRESVQAILEE